MLMQCQLLIDPFIYLFLRVEIRPTAFSHIYPKISIDFIKSNSAQKIDGSQKLHLQLVQDKNKNKKIKTQNILLQPLR